MGYYMFAYGVKTPEIKAVLALKMKPFCKR